jgi:hypothetical protein
MGISATATFHKSEGGSRMRQPVEYQPGMKVRVRDYVIHNLANGFPQEYRKGEVISVQKRKGYSNITVQHANGIWGWINNEIELDPEEGQS